MVHTMCLLRITYATTRMHCARGSGRASVRRCSIPECDRASSLECSPETVARSCNSHGGNGCATYGSSSLSLSDELEDELDDEADDDDDVRPAASCASRGRAKTAATGVYPAISPHPFYMGVVRLGLGAGRYIAIDHTIER